MQVDPWDIGSVGLRTSSKFVINDDEEIHYAYRERSNVMEPSSFVFYTYNELSQLTIRYLGDWDGEYDHITEEFGSDFTTYTYNDQGLLTELHTQNKEQYDNKTPFYLVSHMYNDEGLIESSKAELWSIEADSFAITDKLKYTYSDNLLDNVVRYNDDRERGFISTDSLIFSYNNTGQLVYEGSFKRSTITNDWSLGRNIIIEYNTHGQIARMDVHNRLFLNDVLSTRVDSFFYQYHTYGSLKDITQIQTDTLNEVFVITFELDKEIQEHDSTVRYDQVKRLRVYEPRHEENHMILNYKKQIDFRGDIACSGYQSCLATTGSREYFYSEIMTTSTEEEIAIPPSLYTISPNPSDNIINIRTADEDFSEVTLQLTDLQGRQVFSQKARPDVSIDISHIESGLYIYQVFQDEKVSTGKLVVSR
jgi:YD repeat-containing protein